MSYTRTVAGLISRFSSAGTLGAPVFVAADWTGGTGMTASVVSNKLRVAYSATNPNQNRVLRLDASPSQAKRLIHTVSNGSQGFLCGPAAHVTDIGSTTADYVCHGIYSAASGTDGPYLREVVNGTGSTLVDQAYGTGTGDETSALSVDGTALSGFHHDMPQGATNPAEGTATTQATGQAGIGGQSGGVESADFAMWIDAQDRYCTISGLPGTAATAELRTSADVLVTPVVAVVAGAVTFDMMLMHGYSAIALNKLIVRDGGAAAITALGNVLTNDIYVGGDTYEWTAEQGATTEGAEAGDTHSATSDAAGSRPNTPTLELAAPPTDDAVAVTLSVYSHPDTPDPDALRRAIRGRVARADGSLIRSIEEFTPDAAGEWRTLVLDLLTEDGFIFVQYQDAALRWSDESAGLAYELDTTPVDAPPDPEGEPGGEVSEILYRSEWEWGTSAARLKVFNPLETYTDLFTRTVFVYDDEDVLLARITKWEFQGPVAGGVEQWIGFLKPGHLYTVATTWKYRNGGNYKFSPAREFEVDVPPALDAPRITAPVCGALVSGADINITWEESLDCVLEPGTDLIEISRNGPTWASVGSLASGGANAIAVSRAAHADGIAWLGITRVTGGGSSERRVSKPFFIDAANVGIRRGLGVLDLADFTIVGSVGEAARWSDTGGVLRRDGVATTAGYLILDEAGELRTVDIVADVQFATADGTGNALQYSPDMRSHVGVGAYMGENFQALAVRFRGAFGAFGRLTGQGEGSDAAEWFNGTRQGKGAGYLQPIANNGSVTAHSILATPSREQWMPNTRTGDPWFAVGGRFEQEETYLDGTMRFGVQSLLTGPGNEGAPQVSDVNRNAVTIPCGGCGISVLSESSSVVLIRSLTVYPISEGDCAAEGELGGPCMLELTVYEADNETIAWQSTTSATWLGESGEAVDYLQDPLQIGGGYGEQEVDFAAGTASIGQCNVRMIDPPTAGLMSPGLLNDQDSGWMTLRKTTVAGRRNRLRRFIDEDQGWVTIADGPGGFPKLLGSFAGYEWSIRDTREKERRLRAFAGTSPTVILPFGLLEGQWGAYGEYGQALIEEAGFISAVFIDDPELLPTGGYFQVFEKPEGVTYYPLYNAAMGRATEQRLFPGGGSFPSGYYPNVAVLWRLKGEGDDDWKYAGQQPGDGTAVSERRVFAPTTGYDMFDVQDGVIEGEDVRYIGHIWVSFETGEMPGPGGTEVEFYVLYVGPANEAFPFYIDGITAGQLLKNLYDGLYSPRDPLTGAVVPTGIRYDEDALLLLTTLVRLRVTEPVKDIRAWAEKNIYAPLGYAPALDADGQISPVSQEIPSSIYTYEFFDFTEITNAITDPGKSPGHAPGDNVINIITFQYGRAYSDPDNSQAIDGLVIEDVIRDHPNLESIERHGERELKIETVAFIAVGDENSNPIGDEIGMELFLARRLNLFDRRVNGTDLAVVPCMRIATFMLRVGDWVHVTLSWLPNDNTGRRSLDHLAQVLAVKDLNCSWREFTFELVQPWPSVSP